MQICYILSSKAGAGTCLAYRKLLEEVCRKESCEHSIELAVTTSPDDVYRFARDFGERTGDEGLVYVLGGDGSLSEAAQALAHTPTALGVIPLGTANDFARQLYGELPEKRLARKETLVSCIEASLSPQIKPIDLIHFTCDDKIHACGFCINVLGLGIDSQIMLTAYKLLRHFPRSPRLAYTTATLVEMVKLPSFDVKLEITDSCGQVKRRIDRIVLAALCNSGYYGNGYHPAPRACITDGKANLTLGTKMALPAFARVAKAYKQGTHEGMRHVELMDDVVKLELQSVANQPIPANFDGTRLLFTQLNADIHPKALRFAFIGSAV